MRKQKPKLKQNQLYQAIDFSERVTDPEQWISKAEELLAAAKILDTEVEAYWSLVHTEGGTVRGPEGRASVQPAYSMLVAYAIENFCKALLIHDHRDNLRNCLLTKVPEFLKRHRAHDLIALAKAAGLNLSIPEEGLLYRLSENAQWMARYPVPMGSDKLSASQQFSDGRVYLTAYLRPDDDVRVGQFLDRLRNEVAKRVRDGADWVSPDLR